MSWSIEEHIGEGRPWPEQVVVYRGETDESLTYARRSLSDVNQMVELMDTLAADNAKLRELSKRMARALGVGSNLCDRNCGWEFECDMVSCPIEEAMRELGIEVDA